MTWKDVTNNIKDLPQYKTTCRSCEKLGKTLDDSLSINSELGLYCCHKCGVRGHIDIGNTVVVEPTQELNTSSIQFLRMRGISVEVAVANGLETTANGGGIVFPYNFNNTLVNTKSRSLEGKEFRTMKGGKHILYNHDRGKDGENLIITEGEIDALSFEECGYIAMSVDYGAINENDKSTVGKLECIENSYEIIEKAKIIYLAVDNDKPGKRLEKELVRRCGAEKCKIVDFSPWKDANEVLIYEGKESLLERLKSAKDVKVEGIYTGEEDIDIMDYHWEHGLPKGTTTYIKEIDKCWTWRATDVNLWTGYMNEGKSTFLRQAALIKSVNEGVKWGVYGKEDYPRYDLYTDLIEMYVGMTTDLDKPYRRMSREQYVDARKFIMAHFILFNPKSKPDVHELCEFTTYCVRKYGIFGAWFDPYIGIKHDYNNFPREDLYISEFGSIVKDCAVRNEININVVAHQLTPRKIDNPKSDNYGCYPRPDVYTIKGGGTWADAFDNVNSIWRPRYATDKSETTVIFESQKIKKQKLVGRPGKVEMDFDTKSSRYKINGKNPLESLVIPEVNTNLDEGVKNLLKYNYK